MAGAKRAPLYRVLREAVDGGQAENFRSHVAGELSRMKNVMTCSDSLGDY